MVLNLLNQLFVNLYVSFSKLDSLDAFSYQFIKLIINLIVFICHGQVNKSIKSHHFNIFLTKLNLSIQSHKLDQDSNLKKWIIICKCKVFRSMHESVKTLSNRSYAEWILFKRRLDRRDKCNFDDSLSCGV